MALNNEFYFLKGKVKWFRHTSPNEWGKWSHVLYPDAESLDTIRELMVGKDGISGIKNVLKKDDDGYNMAFGRPTQRLLRGQYQGMSPPEVIDAEGKPFIGNVGNGSDVTTKIVVYKHNVPAGGKAKACRWESTRVDNLVPFEKDNDFPKEAAKQVAGLPEQPAPLF